jgi:hypothetical protein
VAPDSAPDPKWQFVGCHANGSYAGFMLNTDAELFYDLGSISQNPISAENLSDQFSAANFGPISTQK